jgi:hypothetical protein
MGNGTIPLSVVFIENESFDRDTAKNQGTNNTGN